MRERLGEVDFRRVRPNHPWSLKRGNKKNMGYWLGSYLGYPKLKFDIWVSFMKNDNDENGRPVTR